MVNALTGAAIGAGTKLIIDKITGKPVVSGSGSTTKPATGGTTKPATGGTTKPATGGTTKPATGGTTKPATGGTKAPTTSVVKPPVSSDGSATDLYKGTPADESLGLPPGAIDNGDGTYTTVFDDGSSITYSMENDSILYSTDTDGKIDVFENSTDTTVAGGGDSSEETTDGGGTRGLGGTTTGSNDVTEDEDTTVADGSEAEYFQDELGNIYTQNEDGSYELYSDVSGGSEEDTSVADNTWTDPDTGDVWTLGDGGSWTLEGDGETDDSLYADNTWTDPDSGETWLMADDGMWTLEGDGSEYYDDSLFAGDDEYTDYTLADNADYDSYDYGDYEVKKGGAIKRKTKGGLPRFEDGGYSDTEEEVQPWQNVSYNYGEEDDPTLTGDLSLYDSPSVRNTYTSLSDTLDDEETDDRWLLNSFDEEADGATTTSGGTDFTPVPGRQYFDDGSYIDTFDDGSTMTYDYDGNLVDTTDGYTTTRDEAGNYIVTDGYGNMTVYDSDGSLIPLGGGRVNAGPITNVGSGTKKPVVGGVLGNTNTAPDTLGSDFLNTLTGALGTTAGAAGAGALIASLLGSDFGGGGSGAQNQGLDMSQVGIINPRTTDFGIGPTNFVGYDQYGTDEGGYVPNEELLRNLNAPGFNPVNEGDYGYEEVPVEETAEEPAMASGGLSSMKTPVASYYTFGQPADILANLGMRPQPPMNPPDMMPKVGQQQPPLQAQQMPPQMAQQAPQGMPPQGMPPQGMMPQGMPQQMRRGGLPHVSNVPLVQGRMDFRQGSAVHGAGDGQSDDIPAMLADGEYVIDAETVAQIGNGSTKAGAQALDKFREGIRAHKRSAPVNKIPPKTKPLTSYLKGAK